MRQLEKEPDTSRSRIYYRVEIARKVPGFGGVQTIRSPDGLDTLGVYLVTPDTATAALVRRALVVHYQERAGPAADSGLIAQLLARPIKPIKATYDYAELYEWRDEAEKFVFTIPGVNSVGMGANHISIGLDPDSPTARECVQKRLNELSIPRDATVFVDSGLGEAVSEAPVIP